jgi:hypothetical protein
MKGNIWVETYLKELVELILKNGVGYEAMFISGHSF